MRYTISSLLAMLALATPGAAEVPKVVADIPPIGALVAQVMGDLGQPEVLLGAGANAHDFQLRPSQVRSVAGADLVVWVGPELEPWLDRTLDGIGGGGARLTLLGVKGTLLRDFAEPGGHEGHDHDEGHDHESHDHEHDHDHAHDHGAEAEGHPEAADHAEAGAHAGDHDGHSHEGTDPHAWLDPANAEIWLAAIAAELSRIDPENAAAYGANAASGIAGLRKLDAEIAARLAPVQDRPFVTFHDAYGYFTSHFGLNQIGAVSGGDAASPGAARLRELAASVRGAGTICLFPEVQHDPALVAQMAGSGDARVGGALDPEGTGLAPGADGYARLLIGMTDTLVACLGQ